MAGPFTQEAESLITLAHLLRPQGRKGEILAELLTDFPERFADRSGVSLRRPNTLRELVTVESHWLPVGRNAGRIVLKLQGVDSINAAEALAGCDLVVSAEHRIDLDEEDGEEYIADLLDCAVLDGEHSVGVVYDVHFPTNATGTRLQEAAPLLVVHSPTGNELLIPFAKSWIENIDVVQKRIVMRLPEGLLDINE